MFGPPEKDPETRKLAWLQGVVSGHAYSGLAYEPIRSALV